MSRSSVGRDELTFSWSDATPNGHPVTEYQVQVSNAGGQSAGWGATTSTSMSTSFSYASLNPYELYHIRVRAKSDTSLGASSDGWGAWRVSPDKKTIDYPGKPGAPTNRLEYGALSNITTLWIEWAAAAERYAPPLGLSFPPFLELSC